MNKYKVLHITTIDFTIHKMLVDKMNELSKLGYDIDFMSDDTGLSTKIREAGYVHYKVEIPRKIQPVRDLISLVKIYRFLKKHHYDIVHTHTAKAGFIGRIAARLAGVPIVVHTSHGLPFYKGQSPIKNFIYKMLEMIASRFSDGYFSQNQEDLKIINTFVPKRVLTGYEGNGVVLNRIDQYPRLSEEKISQIKGEFSIKNEFLFLMAARFEPVKNHKMLIEAIKLTKTDVPFKILLAGFGPLEEQIKEQVKINRLDKHFIFLGYRNDILDLLQIVDAVLLTSEKEGIPRIIMEAMAMSKPVLATDVLGTRELVVHKQTGELVELNDAKQLNEVIIKWINPAYHDNLKHYGNEGRKRIENYFTEEQVAHRVNSLYLQLIAIKKYQYETHPWWYV